MAVITVGTGKQYSTIPSAIAAAQDGDTIQVDAGTYVNQSAQITKDIAGPDTETDIIDSRAAGIDLGEVYGLQNRGMG